MSAIYIVTGIFSPFWGVWLKSVGLSAEQIGVLLGIGFAMRLCGSLVIMNRAKRAERLLPIARILICLSVISFAGFYLSHEFWVILALTVFINAFNPPLMPIADTIANRMMLQVKLDYGKVRLWGSAAFIAGDMLIGYISGGWGAGWILHCLVAGCILSGFCLALPMTPSPKSMGEERETSGYLSLLRDRKFVLFLLIETLIYGSHAAYSGFSAIYWQESGFSAAQVSQLWATGVVFEIIMFACSQQLLSRWSPEKLMFVATIGCVVRWIVLGTSLELWLLFPAQALHSLTYCQAHLGAMRYLKERMPKESIISGQTMYYAISQSLSMAVLTIVCGCLYRHFHQHVFLVMALIACPAILLIGLLRRYSKENQAVIPAAHGE